MTSHDFRRDILRLRAHRPWPMPQRPWVMSQTWHDLLFAHWPVPPAVMRGLVPSVFPLDLREGVAWLGVVAFHMTNVAPRFMPALPWVSAFPELNVRTYVRVGEKPGIYFFSLDAARVPAVLGARVLLNLPYESAAMAVSGDARGIAYRSVRQDRTAARFEALYAPTGSAFRAAPGSLDYFLTERYCLYHLTHGRRPYRLEIHHPPWTLHAAAASITANTMGDVNGVRLEGRPCLHFCPRQDMVAFWPQRL
jgi:uncharacterized protein YqjF (DUF2071 family)